MVKPKHQTHHTVRDDWLLPILQELVPPATFESFTRLHHDGYWRSAVNTALVTDDQLLAAIARRTRLHVATTLLTTTPARDQIPERIARRYGVLPLTLSATTLDIATGNPYDLDCEQTLAFVSGKRIRMTLASPTRIAQHLDELYRPATSISRLLSNHTPHRIEAVHESPPDTPLSQLTNSALDRPMIQLVDHIVAEGITLRASDIHLEAEETGVAVRYRIDGVLRQAMVLPQTIGIPLVSRIKIIAHMDIADRLRPQGGRARVSVDGTPIDLRVSTLPATHGEKVVIRILDPRTTTTSLSTLGFDPHTRTRLHTLLDARDGLILVTGPTGSGKTTTLYAALQQLLQRGVNIITVEDPVEYRIPGIVQVQVNPKTGLTFAEALRSILRQDPDVVLIGEVRDHETAAIAIQAALTGHLVFATLHTIDACSSITRLQDLGVDSTKIAAALKGAVAQRLIRHLCPHCAAPSSTATPARLWNDIPTGATLLTPKGCQSCNMTGYKGRFAVTEILLTTPELERMIALGSPLPELVITARRSGTHSLWTSGIIRLLNQETSVEEIMRVLEPDYQSLEEPTPHSVDTTHHARYYVEDPPLSSPNRPSMTEVTVGVVDVYIIDPSQTPWRVLTLQRAPNAIRPGSWEAVHGRIEPNEKPEEAAIRELQEETGLSADRLYRITVYPFYLHQTNTVQLAVVFCAFVASTTPVTLSHEHSAMEWLSLDAAPHQFTWPRATQILQDIHKLLANGTAGPVEDALRVF